MNASASTRESSRTVTALFRDMRGAERAYQAATTLGYERSDVNLVMSDETRERFTSRGPVHTEMASEETETADKPLKAEDVGGPTGGAIGTIAPVIAAVGSVVLIPGLVLAGPIAAALAAAGAVGLAGGLIGALTDWGIPRDRTREYEAGIRKGGILIGVKARSDEDAERIEREWQELGGEMVHR
jgi:hypothetical protein